MCIRDRGTLLLKPPRYSAWIETKTKAASELVDCVFVNMQEFGYGTLNEEAHWKAIGGKEPPKKMVVDTDIARFLNKTGPNWF